MKDQGKRLQSTSKHSSLHTRLIDHSRVPDKCPLHGQGKFPWGQCSSCCTNVEVISRLSTYTGWLSATRDTMVLSQGYNTKEVSSNVSGAQCGENHKRLSSLIHLISMVKGLLAARGHVRYVDGEILHVTKNRFLTSYEILLSRVRVSSSVKLPFTLPPNDRDRSDGVSFWFCCCIED